MNINKRLRSLREGVLGHKVEAFLVSSVQNIQYLTGFTGEDSLALVTPERRYIVTDFRFVEQIEQECPGWTIVKRNHDLWSAASGVLKRNRIRRLGFESAHLSHRSHRLLRSASKRVKLVPLVGKVEKLRQVKDAHEVAAIEAALDVSQKAFHDVRRWVRPGMTELQVARELEHRMSRHGAQKPAFDSIVATGERGSLPHARATERLICKGDALLIDWGARRFFYNSDLTRVLHFGKVNAKFERIYGIVLEAQARALATVRPGATFGEVDDAARNYISAKGFGKQFGHSTGHGIGLEVHELPTVRMGNDERLQPGMVFTVEPGIYIPGWGGVRIEDMVLVTDTGARVLSSCGTDIRKIVL